MRLFTGIDLPEQVRERTERLLAHLRPFAYLKWTPAYNLHITIKFIGEWSEARLPELKTALAGVPKRPEIAIELNGLGWFPDAQNPRVFWAAASAGNKLVELARDTETALEPLGIAREKRPYSSHLTLARIRQPTPLQSLRQAITQLDSAEFGAFTAERFHLYSSAPGSAGSIYTKLADFPFTA
jgi:2'-5' RNA ligase